MSESNVMKKITIDKVTLNVGAGKDAGKLEKGIKLLKKVSGRDPVRTVTDRRIQQWGLRPGLPIGCKVTVRGEEAKTLLSRLLTAKDHVLREKIFDNEGNFSFGIHEYIDIEDFDYEPEIGLMGFEVSVTLKRPGFRVKTRRLNRSKIGLHHRISKEESIAFAKEELDVRFNEDV